ncbi:hypothetical protein FGIG_02629 [Fasciola gigantica]|uniref:Uncharacterized protein n=1 Tax=Fasciola gigantica TaxID=46835 RepID=A0A504Z2X0_FASGI|nr:hypothetical protein FGIG_02629 [Fasciola gigantica]
MLPPDTPKRPVDILIHTAIYDEARRVQRQSEDNLFLSSDGTAIMGLPSKRTKKKTANVIRRTTQHGNKLRCFIHLESSVRLLHQPVHRKYRWK